MRRRVIVVGAGVAGLTCAAALAEDGVEVTLLERREFVGGRAYSYRHPALEEVVDSQHVLLGCCTNLNDFCARAGLADKVRWYDKQTFLEPGGRASEIELNGLPAPLQYAGSFARAKMLGAADKAGIARGLAGLMRGAPGDDGESVAQWYKRTGQTAGAVRNFWEPIVLATLNDSSDACSMKYGAKVFYELFLKTRAGGRLGIPTVPLSEFYGAGADAVRGLGGRVELGVSVERMEQTADGRWRLQSGERVWEAEDVVLALPFEQTRTLLAGMRVRGAEADEVRAGLLESTRQFVHSPFISLLFWFDRVVTELDHAWLLGTTIQWMFHKSQIRGYGGPSYMEVIIAGSRKELAMGREPLMKIALREMQEFFPDLWKAKLLKSGLLKEARATFSVTPGLEGNRPEQRTGIAGLFLAGDWTKTGWPSTMEGAARSGRLAAGAVTGGSYLVAELEATGVMRWLAEGRG